MFATTSITPAPAAVSRSQPLSWRGRTLRRARAAAAKTAASSPIRPAATGHSSPDCPALRMRRKNRPNEAPDAMLRGGHLRGGGEVESFQGEGFFEAGPAGASGDGGGLPAGDLVVA